MTQPLRIHRIPFSTNVERVALACALKQVEVEWIDHDADDRTAIRALSGQDLVPVAETPDGPLTDSLRIIAWLEWTCPEPSLWPADPPRRAEADLFCEWFDRVWKGPPNRLAGGEDDPALAAQLAAWLEQFEALLTGRDHLLGDGPSIVDVIAFPFLKYPVLGLARDDRDPFHRVLVETMADPGPRLRDWVARMDALPRA